MDRSNVRETFMKSSYVFNNTGSNMNRSFISTALIGDSLAFNDDLRKSRIQNLPNYKKRDLSQNPQFIIVFQTIQIERLSAEVEVLRMKLTQIGRQLFNTQNYEVQIKQLNEKCFALQKLRVDYTDEIQKLGKICQTLYHENQTLKDKLNELDYSLKQKFQAEKQRNLQLNQQLQKWKARYQATQKSKAKELDDLRNMMQSQRKSMIDRQIKEISIRFQNQRSGLQNQIRKGRQALENRNREIDDLRQKCKKYEINIMELKNYEGVIAENQNRIVLLNQQLMRLKQILTKKDLELQDYKQRQFKLNQQLKAQQDWQHENKQLKNALENRARQIQQWKVRSSRLEDEVGKGREMIHYNQQLTEKLNVSGREIERLNNMFRTRLDQIEDLKGKLTRKDAEIGKLKNLENEKANYENRANILQAENDRINGILKTRLVQLEDWKGRCSKLEGTLNNYSTLQREKKGLEQKLNNQLRNNQQLQFTIKKVEKDANVYKNFENQYKEADRQNAIMGKQLQRLNGVIRNYNSQIDDYRTKQGRMQKALSDFRNAELEIKDLGNRINSMTQEKERLNGLLKSKNDDIANLQNEKLGLHKQINHYKNYQIKINEADQVVARQKEDIAKLRKDIQNWQGKAKQAESKSRELENNLFQNNSQKQRLSTMIKSKNNEYEFLRSQYARLEGDTRRITQLEGALKQQHMQIQRYISDIQQITRTAQNIQTELEKQKNVSNQFAYKIIVLSCQLQRMAVHGASKSAVNNRQFQELQQDYSRLQSKITSKNNQIDILMTKISSLEQKVQQLTQQFHRLYQQAQREEQETIAMVKKVDEYQDYAKRIHILGAQIDRLRAENKAYDQDARRIRLKFADGFAIEKKIEDFNIITVLMGVEIDCLRSRVDQRQINIDQMRKSILQPVRRI